MSPRERANQRLLDLIRVLHAESGGTLGAPRIHEYFYDEGEQCGLNRVARMMHKDKIQAFRARKSTAASRQASGRRTSKITGGLRQRSPWQAVGAIEQLLPIPTNNEDLADVL